MSKLVIVTDTGVADLPDGNTWLVLGPYCWGRDKNLCKAIQNAATEMSYFEGTFTARVIPPGQLTIDGDGSYKVDGWTPEQQERAKVSTRLVAVSGDAATRWTREYRLRLRKG